MEKIVGESVVVTVLKEGYACVDKDGWMRANASCTLIQTPENTVIVDTLTPWDGQFILDKLKELGLSPEAVTHVVSTHGHSDHNGNNNLFLNAKHHISGYCVSNKDLYYAHPFEQDEPFVIDQFLQVIPTPGHTNEDVSIVAKLNPSNEILVVAGDLFECVEDLLTPSIWTANSFQPEVQIRNRLKVLKMAKYIVPGHGKLFQVLPEHINAAEELAQRYERASSS